jgi:ribonucleoside-diphosphate reductase alpha chain
MQDMIDGDMKKRQIWAKVLESRQQKGLPYIFFTDNINRNKPQVYKDKNLTIHASNLCSEIALPSSEDESFICCLSSMNLELYDEWKDTDAVKLAVFFLDAVLQEFIVKTEDNYYLENANRFAKRHRALGLGVLGWHSYLQKNMIAFEGMEAKQLTNRIFKDISEKAEKATRELAWIYGEPEVLKGYGKRNTTLMAIAPTTSSSAILGQTSPGIEPFSSNYFKAGLSKGNFMRKNKYLKALLEEKGIDNEDTWRDIMLNHGSVQHIDELTEHEKEVFKTFKEISQLEIIQQASIRQKYIDQAQSLNLNIPSNLPVKDVNRLLIEAWKLGVKTLYYQRSQSVSKEMVTNLVNCKSCEA